MMQFVHENIKAICTVAIIIGIICVVVSIITGVIVTHDTGTELIQAFLSEDKFARIRLMSVIGSAAIVLLGSIGLICNK